MHDKDLKNLIEKSEVKTSDDFTLGVMGKINKLASAAPALPKWMLMVGSSVCVLLVVVLPFTWLGFSGGVSFGVLDLSGNEIIKRPIQILMVVFTLLCCGQILKILEFTVTEKNEK